MAEGSHDAIRIGTRRVVAYVNWNDVTWRVNDRQSSFHQFSTQIANILLMSSTQVTTFITPQDLHNIQASLSTMTNPLIKCNINTETRRHFDPQASIWMPPPAAVTHSNVWPWPRPDLQNLISLSVTSATSSPKVWWNSVHCFVRYHADRMHARTDAVTDGQPESIMPPLQPSVQGGSTNTVWSNHDESHIIYPKLTTN